MSKGKVQQNCSLCASNVHQQSVASGITMHSRNSQVIDDSVPRVKPKQMPGKCTSVWLWCAVWTAKKGGLGLDHWDFGTKKCITSEGRIPTNETGDLDFGALEPKQAA
jgi:hypothetical protein